VWLPETGPRFGFALKQKECAVLPLTAIALTASEYARLEKLARVAAQEGDVDAMFLLAKINRADIVPDDARDVQSIVTIGSWVTYWSSWGVRRKTVQLVWPEDRTSDLARISVLSGLGAALLGLRAGDQMPYFVAGCMNVVRIESVNRSKTNVVPLFGAPVPANDEPANDDPGPAAA
jgi:transcription elongation GreA/GreB family factor